MMSYLDWILPFLVVLTVLIFVHELGHYLVAKRCRVKVEVFSIGFGPELFGRTDRSGTRWRVSAVPLGGYVKMHGEETFEDSPDATAPAGPDPLSFKDKTLPQRAAIVSAGPLANLAFALVVLLGLFAIVGRPAPLPAVGSVQEGSAAAEAGLQPGDLVLEIDGTPIQWFEDLRNIVNANADRPLRLSIERAETVVDVVATPRLSVQTIDGEERQVGLLGVRPDLARVGYQKLSLPAAVGAAVEQTYGLTAQIFGALASIVQGDRPLDELGGPLRIAQLSGQVAQDGAISLLYFMAALSVNLALINLLPIPVLDGGHLLIYAVEAIGRRPLSKRVIEYAFRAGMIFVVGLMLLATWNDLENLKVIEFFRRLVS